MKRPPVRLALVPLAAILALAPSLAQAPPTPPAGQSAADAALAAQKA